MRTTHATMAAPAAYFLEGGASRSMPFLLARCAQRGTARLRLSLNGQQAAFVCRLRCWHPSA